MIYYQISDIFTLLPQQFYNSYEGENALMKIFGIGSSYSIQDIQLPEYRAVLCYAIHQNTLKKLKKEDKVYPYIYKLIPLIKEGNNYNNAIFHFNAEVKICHIIVCENKELKIINSFKCDNFESALYFLLLSVKKLNMNPKQTTVRVCSNLSPNENVLIHKFFRGVEINILDNSNVI